MTDFFAPLSLEGEVDEFALVVDGIFGITPKSYDMWRYSYNRATRLVKCGALWRLWDSLLLEHPLKELLAFLHLGCYNGEEKTEKQQLMEPTAVREAVLLVLLRTGSHGDSCYKGLMFSLS